MNATTGPKLAAPGAGLPAPEFFVARALFALKCRTGSRDAFIAGFREERAKIRALVDSCPPARRGDRVLIRRLRGMEDSSRHWSVWMTLDHLRIVNGGIAAVIGELGRGRVPEMQVGTADVKPDPAVTAAVEDEYERSCDGFLDQVGKVADLKAGPRHPHPWFGPLDGFRWLAIASIHMGIHRAQLAAIIRGLNP